MVHSVSSDWQISEGDSFARNHEPLEGLSHEQHANEFNSAQDDADGGHGKRECEIETEKYSEVLQLSSDLRKMLQNAQKIQRIRMQTSPQATRMFHSRTEDGHVESNDRLQVHAK